MSKLMGHVYLDCTVFMLWRVFHQNVSMRPMHKHGQPRGRANETNIAICGITRSAWLCVLSILHILVSNITFLLFPQILTLRIQVRFVHTYPMRIYRIIHHVMMTLIHTNGRLENGSHVYYKMVCIYEQIYQKNAFLV